MLGASLAFAALTLVMGTFGAWLHLDGIAALWRSQYGRRLMLTLVLLSIVVGAGAYAWIHVRPRLGQAWCRSGQAVRRGRARSRRRSFSSRRLPSPVERARRPDQTAPWAQIGAVQCAIIESSGRDSGPASIPRRAPTRVGFQNAALQASRTACKLSPRDQRPSSVCGRCRLPLIKRQPRVSAVPISTSTRLGNFIVRIGFIGEGGI